MSSLFKILFISFLSAAPTLGLILIYFMLPINRCSLNAVGGDKEILSPCRGWSLPIEVFIVLVFLVSWIGFWMWYRRK